MWYRVALFILLSFPSFGQDSLQSVEIPRWVAWRMLHEVNLYRACDTLQRYQDAQIKAGLRVIQAADSLIEAKDRQLALSVTATRLQEERFQNIRAENKELRRGLKRAKLTSIGIGALAILLLFL